MEYKRIEFTKKRGWAMDWGNGNADNDEHFISEMLNKGLQICKTVNKSFIEAKRLFAIRRPKSRGTQRLLSVKYPFGEANIA